MSAEKFGGPFPAYISSQQSVDFGAMTAGVASAQVTIQGASAGDAIVVCKPSESNIANSISLSGFCDTADTVDVIARSNDNTATTNLSAETLTVLVFPA